MAREAGVDPIPHDGSSAGPAGSRLVLPVTEWCVWGLEQCPPTPDVAFIEPMLRRRLSPLARSALASANRASPDGRPARFVFASRHGELKRNADMLQELAQGQAPSPMNFSLSVLNAVAGLFGIARGDHSASSAVSAGRATVPLALLEGAMQAWLHPDETVLVVCADEPPPALYEDLVDEPDCPYALAVAMNAGTATATSWIRCAWSPAGDDAAQSPRSAVAAFAECARRQAMIRWVGPDHAWQWQPNQIH
jgi:hypothetical protein